MNDTQILELTESILGPVEDTVSKYELYNGDVTLYFEKDGHEYFRFDEAGARLDVPGVTTVTDALNKPALVPWAAKMTVTYIEDHFDFSKQYTPEEFALLLLEAKRNFQNYKDAAAQTGKLAHEYLELWIKAKIRGEEYQGPLPEDPRAVNGVFSAFMWMDAHHVEWIASERKVYSLEHDYAGTFDGLAYVDGMLSIMDFKTSNYLDRLKFGMQTAAYELAQEEEYGLDIKERWVLRLSKEEAEFEPMHLKEDQFQRDIDAYLSTLDTYRKVKSHSELCKADREAEKARLKALKEAEKLAAKQAKAAAKKKPKPDLDLEMIAASILSINS